MNTIPETGINETAFLSWFAYNPALVGYMCKPMEGVLYEKFCSYGSNTPLASSPTSVGLGGGRCWGFTKKNSTIRLPALSRRPQYSKEKSKFVELFAIFPEQESQMPLL